MKKVIFAISTALIMSLLAFSAITASADSDGVIFGTVHGVYENDWGELIKKPLSGVKITITRSDGDVRAVYTDSYGHFEHTVNYEKYKNYVVKAESIEIDITEGGETTTYIFGGSTEYIRRTDWNPWSDNPTVEIDIDMIGKEKKSREISLPILRMFILDKISDFINARLFMLFE